MHICITVRGQELIFEDIVTGQPLHGTQRLRDLVKKEEQRAEMEKQRAELRELGIDPDEITG
jgi:transcriptional regulator of met regulon